MKLYISLPISGREEKARERAQIIANKIKEAGHTPVNPFDINAGENPDYFDHLCADLRVMMDCDAVYFDKGFYASCGCLIEENVARSLIRYKKKYIRIIYGDLGLKAFQEELQKLKELEI